MEVRNIIDWILSEGKEYVDARRLAKRFNITTHTAGRILKNLQKLGYLKIYKKRKGRFTIYRVGDSLDTHR